MGPNGCIFTFLPFVQTDTSPCDVIITNYRFSESNTMINDNLLYFIPIEFGNYDIAPNNYWWSRVVQFYIFAEVAGISTY